MICRLCLTSLDGANAEIVVLFGQGLLGTDETKTIKLIAKYLCLELKSDDNVSTIICRECYQHLDDFHQFYRLVEHKQDELRKEFVEIKSTFKWTDDGTSRKANGTSIVYENDDEAETCNLLDMDEKLLSIENFAFESTNVDAEQLPWPASDEEEFVAVNNGDAIKVDDMILSDDDLPLSFLKPKKEASTKQSKTKPKHKKTKKNVKSVDDNKNVTEIEVNGLSSPPPTPSSPLPAGSRGKKNKRGDQEVDDIISNFMTLSCDLDCEFKSRTFGELSVHFKREHNCPVYVKCCNRTFARRSRLLDHVRWHTDPTIYSCPICKKKLRSKRTLEAHMENAHKKNPKRKMLPCSKCERKFRSEKCLVNHMKRHDDGLEGDSVCEQCNKSFANIYRLRRHIEAIHENLHLHVCDTCGKKFKFKPSFERHLLEHKGVVAPTVQCQTCGVWLKNEHCLRLHRFTHDKTNCECTYCGKVCLSRTALRGHVKYTHKLKCDLQCTYCEKTFKEKRNLQEHMAMHMSVQLYSCQHCQKEFRSKSNMYVHIKRQHPEEWLKAKIARSNDPTHKNVT